MVLDVDVFGFDCVFVWLLDVVLVFCVYLIVLILVFVQLFLLVVLGLNFILEQLCIDCYLIVGSFWVFLMVVLGVFLLVFGVVIFLVFGVMLILVVVFLNIFGDMVVFFVGVGVFVLVLDSVRMWGFVFFFVVDRFLVIFCVIRFLVEIFFVDGLVVFDVDVFLLICKDGVRISLLVVFCVGFCGGVIVVGFVSVCIFLDISL